MKGFSILRYSCPVFYGDHVHHKASLELFDSFDKSTACCAAHTLVEVSHPKPVPTSRSFAGLRVISRDQPALFDCRPGRKMCEFIQYSAAFAMPPPIRYTEA